MSAGPGLPPAQVEPFGKRVLSSDLRLWRVHDFTRPATVFNPCIGRRGRFSPLYDATGACIPTLYAGETREAAMFETVFRDLPPLPLARQVFTKELNGRAISELRTRRPLRLAPMFNQNLAIIGQSRQTMIECHGAEAYEQTCAWAEAIHRDFPDIDGLVWTSRQQDEALAMVLFEERIAPGNLEEVGSEHLDRGPARNWVSQMAKAYKIDLIPS
jgi:RES domain